MLDKAKKSWQQLKRGKPGKRFQERHKRKHEAGSHPFRKVATLVIGGVIFAAGIFFLPAPGPGTIILAIGAGILSQESLWMAKALDWAEVRARKVASWALGIWKRASPLQKAGIVAVKVLVGAGVAYLTWRVMFA
jgi:uncharacterized protein (TIGR02611 family)